MNEHERVKMPSRQRASAAIHYQAPDRIPVMHAYLPAALYQHGDELKKLWAQFPQDFGDLSGDPIPAPQPECVSADGSYYERQTDAWGVVWECSVLGIMGHPLKRPLDDLAHLATYQAPLVPAIQGPTFQAEKQAIAAHQKQFYARKGWVSIFEVMHALRRFEDVLMDIYDDTPEINRLADLITDYWGEVIAFHLKTGVDGLQFGDDFGTQQAMMLDLETWRRFFKPRYARLIAPIKKAGKDVFFHSCGHTLPLIDDLADLGVNVFWPQMNVNDMTELSRRCRNRRMCLMLHFDRQKLMPFGTPAEIDLAVKEAIDRYGDPAGGIILYGEIDNNFPLANIRALYEAFERYR